jgi:hypothetical protein
MVTAPVVPPTTTLRAHDAISLPRRCTGSQSKGSAPHCSQPELLKPNELVNDGMLSMKYGADGSTSFQTSDIMFSLRCYAVEKCELAAVACATAPRTYCTSHITN